MAGPTPQVLWREISRLGARSPDPDPKCLKALNAPRERTAIVSLWAGGNVVHVHPQGRGSKPGEGGPNSPPRPLQPLRPNKRRGI